MSVVAIREFKTAAEMRAYYVALRHRDRMRKELAPRVVFLKQPEPKPEAKPEPTPVIEIPEPVIPTVINKDGGVRVGWVIQVACRWYGISKIDLLSHRRTKELIWPRQIAYYLCKEHTKLGLPTIGRKFDRDHTTILHGVRKVAKRRETDWRFSSEISGLERIVLRQQDDSADDVWSG